MSIYPVVRPQFEALPLIQVTFAINRIIIHQIVIVATMIDLAVEMIQQVVDDLVRHCAHYVLSAKGSTRRRANTIGYPDPGLRHVTGQRAERGPSRRARVNPLDEVNVNVCIILFVSFLLWVLRGHTSLAVEIVSLHLAASHAHIGLPASMCRANQ